MAVKGQVGRGVKQTLRSAACVSTSNLGVYVYYLPPTCVIVVSSRGPDECRGRSCSLVMRLAWYVADQLA